MTEEGTPPAEPTPGLAPSPTPPPSNGPQTLRKASRWEIYFPSKGNEATDSVYVASFPKIIYFWPSIVGLLVCGLLQSMTDISPNTLAWWSIGLVSANLLVIVQDFDQKKFTILVLLGLAVGLGAWIMNLKDVAVLGKFFGWLGGFDVSASTGAYIVMGLLMLIFLLWGLIRPSFDYWRLEPNEFVHYIQPFGRDISIPRMGHTVNKEIPDILEFLLTLGGGSLVVRSGDRVVARIPDIPLLGRRMVRIEQMLGVTRVSHVQNV